MNETTECRVITVKEVFEKAYGKMADDAVCGVFYINQSGDAQEVPCYWTDTFERVMEFDGSTWVVADAENDCISGPNITNARAMDFICYFGSEYARAYENLVSEGRL